MKTHPARTWTADNGNGTFSNPLFNTTGTLRPFQP